MTAVLALVPLVEPASFINKLFRLSEFIKSPTTVIFSLVITSTACLILNKMNIQTVYKPALVAPANCQFIWMPSTFGMSATQPILG